MTKGSTCVELGRQPHHLLIRITCCFLLALSGSCGTPRYLSNGQRRYSGTTVGNIVTYICNSRYSRTAGSSSRTCQSNGLWSGSHPMCISKFIAIAIYFSNHYRLVLQLQLLLVYYLNNGSISNLFTPQPIVVTQASQQMDWELFMGIHRDIPSHTPVTQGIGYQEALPGRVCLMDCGQEVTLHAIVSSQGLY